MDKDKTITNLQQEIERLKEDNAFLRGQLEVYKKTPAYYIPTYQPPQNPLDPPNNPWSPVYCKD